MTTRRPSRAVPAMRQLIAFCSFLALFAGVAPLADGRQPDPPGQARGTPPKHEAYLFAHMIKSDYGRLYYTVSLDGLHWRMLNAGKRITDDYRGHPDICRGHDGRYYLVGNRGDSAPDINFWVSPDLITWTRHGDYAPDLSKTPDHPHPLKRIGAPKLFFDQASSQYLLTWHTPNQPGSKDDAERYWASQRTLYVTSRDLKTFSEAPRRLFAWDMATIDVIIRPEGGRYYAIIKDERYPTLDWVTGKTIRICSAPSLLGPYTEPGPPISPNFREAPTLIPSPDGKIHYLYYEQYPGVAYGLSVAAGLNGPWYQVAGGMGVATWNKYEMPPGVRHGCMIPITRQQYDAIVAVSRLPMSSTLQQPMIWSLVRGLQLPRACVENWCILVHVPLRVEKGLTACLGSCYIAAT